jgi:DNA-binding GntR family transcriptional regulator
MAVKTKRQEPLSEREATVLACILDDVSAKGYAPSNRELAERLGCSHVAIHYAKQELKKRKLLKSQPGMARAVRVDATGAAADLFLLFAREALNQDAPSDATVRQLQDAFEAWRISHQLVTGRS